ncbi:MAG: hypothetical protein R2828_04100 [Saprospiraceae bacterium]
MKNILIIYPHWHPANLAGVHRPRLIGNYLPEMGWHPIILTVKPEYYEEKPDLELQLTFRDHFEVIRVDAFPIPRPRVVGDLGIRAFFQLLKKAKEICKSRKIDFVWIPVPSYYPALIGRLLYNKFKIPYGIDYIDPWTRSSEAYKDFGIRMKLSLLTAEWLEPIAVHHARLISGVSKLYYQPVLDKNFRDRAVLDVAMPYGFDPNDHEITLDIPLPWDSIENCNPFLYAGAFLPNSRFFYELLFLSIDELIKEKKWNPNNHLFFIGTGQYPGKTIKELSEKYNCSYYIHEFRERRPFLHILNYLRNAKGILVIGSTSPHYTASKIFQAILSKKPIFAIFHNKSTVIDILNETKSDHYLVKYVEEQEQTNLKSEIKKVFLDFVNDIKDWAPLYETLNKYSSKESTRLLVEQLDKISD